DSIYKWGVSINGPATGGWAGWGTSLYNDTTRKMYDDGTHGDANAGDRIFTRVIKFYKDSVNNVVGQEFKFGIHGGDNEGGKGGFGNNHIENINDAAATAAIHSQFGSINPLYYDRWDFAAEVAKDPVSVAKTDASVPTVYALDQNFPNPFNPTTTISYALPNSGLVTLKIYNVLGQEVKALINAVQDAGTYHATFDASQMSSGIYFYRLESGSFTSVKKMMLLK
ncbi:MAG: T9SS type A sorting domain-containing protein, partial [Bacteriovoracaceae bacterium]